VAACPGGRPVAAFLVLLATYGATTTAWDAYFLAMYQKTRDVVVSLGGRPMSADYVPQRHGVWHNMWVGLGDFDHTYGHNFDDRQAFRAMFTILERDYHQTIPHLGPTAYFFDDAFWDEKQTYAKLGDELPHYYDAIRDDLIAQIRRDPTWYAGILRERVWRSTAELAPVRLALDPWRKVTLPFHGLALLPLLLALIASRNWMRLKLALFTLPVCATAIAVYSGQGLQYYACYHLVAAAILLACPVDAVLWWRARRAGNAGWAHGAARSVTTAG